MKIVFLGTGDAIDENYFNTSILLLNKTRLLLDCGYSIPIQLWKYNPDPSFLDAIYISHLHSDHSFGLPALLIRMKINSRKKPLTIIYPKGQKKMLTQTIHYGHRRLLSRAGFPIKLIEATPKKTINLNDYQLSFASTLHNVVNLAVRLFCGNKVICYGGDGDLTPALEKLCHQVDLLIYEGCVYRKNLAHHAAIEEVIKMAQQQQVKQLALVHLKKHTRKKQSTQSQKTYQQKDLIITFPNPGDEITI